MTKLITNQWQLGIRSDIIIDFCIHVIQSDGLHVDSFNKHRQYIGPLQSIGLNEDNWMDWVKNILEVHQTVSSNLSKLTEKSEIIDSLKLLRDPISSWTGSLNIKKELSKLWQTYLAYFPNKGNNNVEENIRLLNTSSLWEDIQVYRKRISSLNVIVVDYMSISGITIKPNYIVVSFGKDKLDGNILEQNVLQLVVNLVDEKI